MLHWFEFSDKKMALAGNPKDAKQSVCRGNSNSAMVFVKNESWLCGSMFLKL